VEISQSVSQPPGLFGFEKHARLKHPIRPNRHESQQRLNNFRQAARLASVTLLNKNVKNRIPAAEKAMIQTGLFTLTKPMAVKNTIMGW
jgi:hypothetical protein